MSQEEIRVKMVSQIKVKTIEEFLCCPAAYLSFRSHLQTSKLSKEFNECLEFWEAVSRRKERNKMHREQEGQKALGKRQK
jgi:hypothetical protein